MRPKVVDLEFARIGQRSLLLDLDFPKHASPPFPVIVWLFGGGWMSGSRQARPVVRLVDDNLLKQGYVIAAVDYRLSDEAIFPAQIEDCKAAIRWLRANAASYDLDPSRIGVWGFSAGAHLAALLGTTGTISDFDGVGANLEYASKVQAVCTFAVTSDFLQMRGLAGYSDPDDPASTVSRLFGGLVKEKRELAARANPITYITSECPPFLIIHGEKDEVVSLNQSELLDEALKQLGIEASLYVIPEGDHGMKGLSEIETTKIVNMVADFFNRHLGVRD